VARAIHYMSPVRKNAFISINCAAIPENLIEAELFGFEKGAFTGAVSTKKGLFEMAEGGTLFLDEIGTLPFHLQSKLLGVLDEKTLRRLGGKSIRPLQVRIVAATNMDIEAAVKAGEFREDLYYRINVIRIHIPPLRERLQDIPDLCRFFISRFAPDNRIGIPDDEAIRLMAYHWPGNVRELGNVIERSIILSQGSTLRPSELLAGDPHPFSSPVDKKAEETDILTLADLEKAYIRRALDALSGNHTRTAKALGISRSTLKRKLKGYGIA
jgi:transcriptional regulator with PAS, ATPase and Fis domain